MINDFEFKDYGPINNISGQALGEINLIIGANGTGKTFLLKALYSAIKSHEETGRGDDQRDFSEVLSDKLYWTFQADKIGDLVAKGRDRKLQASLTLNDNSSLAFTFGPDTKSKAVPLHNNLTTRTANSVFLPPKEVLSLIPVIMKSRLQDKEFGFDDTYLDLVLALQVQSQRGRNRDAFSQSRQRLEAMFDGKVEFDVASKRWIYKKGRSKFPISTTAEGVKKIAILDTLLSNRFLTHESIIFIDEPESALHPTAIVEFLDIISVLAQAGIQFFIASHSYYVIKKLLLIANERNLKIPTFMAQDGGEWRQSCLLEDGLPDNEIINESIRLFEQEFTGSF